MARYAVLGATGNCGAAVTELLLQRDDTIIHAYCRNKQKLLTKIPAIADNKRVKIFEGSINDLHLLAECIRDTKAVFHLVTTNENVPGYSVGQETARAIVAALEQAGPQLTKPRIVLLSSGTIDDHICHISPLPRWLLLTAFSNVYEDLRRTEAFLRTKDDLVTTIFVKPGGLTLDAQNGHRICFDEDESFVSYLDLAAGMIEVADDAERRYDMRSISVNNKNGSSATPDGLVKALVLGLARHFFPFLHGYLPYAA